MRNKPLGILLGMLVLAALVGCQSGTTNDEVKDLSQQIQKQSPKDAVDTVGAGDAVMNPGPGGGMMVRKGGK